MIKKILLLFFAYIISLTAGYSETVYYTVNQGFMYRDGIYINNWIYGSYSKCDPISISYKHETYYMVDDNKKPYSRSSLLGCEDYARNTLFDPLIKLNDDNIWERLTPDEIRRANVRFVRVKINGKLDLYDTKNDFNLDKIAYIDLHKLRFLANGFVGGEVDMYVKTPHGNLNTVTIHINSKLPNQADRMF